MGSMPYSIFASESSTTSSGWNGQNFVGAGDTDEEYDQDTN